MGIQSKKAKKEYHLSGVLVIFKVAVIVVSRDFVVIFVLFIIFEAFGLTTDMVFLVDGYI